MFKHYDSLDHIVSKISCINNVWCRISSEDTPVNEHIYILVTNLEWNGSFKNIVAILRPKNKLYENSNARTDRVDGSNEFSNSLPTR